METLKVNDKVWVITNNKVVEIVVSKIIKTTELKTPQTEIGTPVEVTKLKVWASYSELFNHEFEVLEGNYFATKQILIDSL